MINHPNAMNPGKILTKKELYQQCHHMFLAGAKAILLCHEMCEKVSSIRVRYGGFTLELSSGIDKKLLTTVLEVIRDAD